MRFKYFLILLLGLTSLIFQSWSLETKLDSVEIRRKFDPVVVTTDRLESAEILKFIPLYSIKTDTVGTRNLLQVTDALQYSPGLYVRDYGGLGGLKTVSIRGTTSQQTAVLLDGIRLNGSQTGIMDFSSFPVSVINAMEVLRGGASGLYGGSAIGGVINLITRENRESSYARASLHYGSFEEFGGSFKLYLPFDEDNLSLSLNYLSSRGNYPYNITQYGREIQKYRQNDDFRNLGFSISGEHNTPGIMIRSMFIGYLSERGTPGAVIYGSEESSLSRLKEKELVIVNKINFPDFKEITLDISARFNNTVYINPEIPSVEKMAVENHYFNRNIAATSKWTTDLAGLTSEFILEWAYADLRGDMLDPELSSYIHRNSFALAARFGKEIQLFKSSKLNIFTGIRADEISDAGSAFSPILGLSLLNESIPLMLRASLSYNFRPPSFNEMYYLNFGNANLNPERSLSANVGTTIFLQDNFSFNLDGFLISTHDQILAVPKSTISWSAKNLAEVVTSGLEVNMNYSLFNKSLRADLSYTLQTATDKSPESITYNKKIVYVPNELLNLQIDFTYSQTMLAIIINHASHRYSLPDNSYESMLPSYTILDINLCESFYIYGNKVILGLECRNVLDTAYSVIRNYPLPGRSFRVYINYTLNTK